MKSVGNIFNLYDALRKKKKMSASVRATLWLNQCDSQEQNIETSFSLCLWKIQKREQTHKSDGWTVSCFNGTFQLHTWLHQRRLLFEEVLWSLKRSFYVSSVVDDFGPPDWSFRPVRFLTNSFNRAAFRRAANLYFPSSFLEIPSRFRADTQQSAAIILLEVPRFLDSSIPFSPRNDDCFSRRD